VAKVASHISAKSVPSEPMPPWIIKDDEGDDDTEPPEDVEIISGTATIA
jgi:hypothetical protein